MTKRYTIDTIHLILKTTIVAAGFFAVGVCATAIAETGPGPAVVASPSVPVGEATRSWLELQRSNAQAAPALPVLGAEAGLAYQRYLESFKKKIPNSFDSALGTSGNGLRGDYMNAGGASPAGAN